MKRSSKRPTARVMAIVFAIIPCVLGGGLGLYLNWNGTIWLSDTRGVWPVICIGGSIAAILYLAVTVDYDRTVYASAWLLITWTWQIGRAHV